MPSNKPIPTVLFKQGLRNVVYRDPKGKTYSGTITSRASATQGTFQIWRGGKKYVVASKNVVSTNMHQADVVRFSGH
jgi:hypothetical protein